jgi:hypothetical protein
VTSRASQVAGLAASGRNAPANAIGACPATCRNRSTDRNAGSVTLSLAVLRNKCADGIGGTFIRRWLGTPLRQ